MVKRTHESAFCTPDPGLWLSHFGDGWTVATLTSWSAGESIPPIFDAPRHLGRVVGWLARAGGLLRAKRLVGQCGAMAG